MGNRLAFLWGEIQKPAVKVEKSEGQYHPRHQSVAQKVSDESFLLHSL